MQLHQARYFVALAKALNFTRAAEACGVTQPTLTRAVKLLEQELGGELIRRERGLSRLTELGERMLPPLTRCVAAAADARAMAEEMRSLGPVALRIALAPGIDAALVSDAVAAFVRGRRRLRLGILRGGTEEVAEALRAGTVELAVGPVAGMDWPRFESWPLAAERLHLIAAAGHPLAGCGAVPPAALAGHTLIRRGFCASDAWVAAALEQAEIPFGAVIETADEADTAALLVAGAGVAIAPWSPRLRPGLAAVPVSGLDLRRTVLVHAVAGRRRSALARTLLAGLRAATKGTGDDRDAGPPSRGPASGTDDGARAA